MHASTSWINDYLDRPATADEIAEGLTMAGFPVEHREEVSDGPNGPDIRLDVELTSNRGDCLSHVGLAREIAARSGRTLNHPAPKHTATGPDVATLTRVTNLDHARCPLYAARVLRGLTVGPSPEWLASRLRAIGQIPRNNVVDATNFVLFELGQPTHVFDLAKLKGSEIIVRRARRDEPFLPLGEGERPLKLTEDDLVIADAEDAVAIAGVKGGASSAVSATTRDVLIEAATFDPVGVRLSARRHRIESASAYRYERGVDPRFVNMAAERLVDILLDVAGGELAQGVSSAGAAISADPVVMLRPERCRAILGFDVSDDRIADTLARLGFQPVRAGDEFRCTVPAHRMDIEREIDLIEEVSRMVGHDVIPVRATIPVYVMPVQPAVRTRRAVAEFLVGAGYLETVTHSLVSEKAASLFLPGDLRMLRVGDERAKAEPILRPSLLPSLLRVLAHNLAVGVSDAKFFESASTFVESNDGHIERVNIGLLHPATDADQHARELRGVIDRLIEQVFGVDARISVEPTDRLPWFAPGAAIRVNDEHLGVYGRLSPEVLKTFDLTGTVLAAEIGLPAHYDRAANDREVRPMPAFPAIERDLSAILHEHITWAAIERAVRSLQLAMLESVEFITTYRGRQIGEGRKSVTLRLRFRAVDRTLTHDEVDPQMDQAMHTISTALGGEIRR